MEKQLFEWKEWDQVATGCFFFFCITLVKQIGDYEVGTTFDSAIVNFETGELTLQKDKNDPRSSTVFQLRLEVI